VRFKCNCATEYEKGDKSMLAHFTREAWLELAIERLRPLFATNGKPIPSNTRVTIGFTSNGKKSAAIGEVWSNTCSEGDYFEVFIHPKLGRDEALATLVHELCHVAVGLDCGHKGKFKALALSVGLEGPMRATKASSELQDYFKTLGLPDFPHARLNTDGKSTSRKKQKTNLIKCQCPVCGYVARITRKWTCIAVPYCPCGEGSLDPEFNDSDDSVIEE
jgi:hypothetical protein